MIKNFIDINLIIEKDEKLFLEFSLKPKKNLAYGTAGIRMQNSYLDYVFYYSLLLKYFMIRNTFINNN